MIVFKLPIEFVKINTLNFPCRLSDAGHYTCESETGDIDYIDLVVEGKVILEF